jgi:NAD(P)-dependent dehydrogenase (short-subunit alcohol dehydrogenase family)
MREIGVRVKLVEPGMIKTNFGNAMEFNNDSSLSEYQRLVGKLWEIAGSMRANAAEAMAVAEVIFTAATDDTDQLRYTAGEDAKHLASQRDSQDDATFFEQMRTFFGL